MSNAFEAFRKDDPLAEVLEALHLSQRDGVFHLQERGVSFDDLLNFVRSFFRKWGHCINLRNNRFIGDGVQHIIFSLVRFARNDSEDSFEDLESTLLSKLTKNDTFYFRNIGEISSAVDFLKNSGKREPYIASWPCSTGEEPKTIATLSHLNGLNPNIHGYDLVPQNIEEARKSLNFGIKYALSFLSDASKWKGEDYQRRSLRKIVEERYLSPEERSALHGIIQKIHFDAIDVLSDADLENDGIFDCVTSLNFLRYSYLTPEAAIQFIRRMYQRLKIDGVLLLDQTLFDEAGELGREYNGAIYEIDNLFKRLTHPFLGTNYTLLQKKN